MFLPLFRRNSFLLLLLLLLFGHLSLDFLFELVNHSFGDQNFILVTCSMLLLVTQSVIIFLINFMRWLLAFLWFLSLLFLRWCEHLLWLLFLGFPLPRLAVVIRTTNLWGSANYGLHLTLSLRRLSWPGLCRIFIKWRLVRLMQR